MFEKKMENKNKKVHIAAVVSPEDYDLLKNLANKTNLSMGEVIRQIIAKNRSELEKIVN